MKRNEFHRNDYCNKERSKTGAATTTTPRAYGGKEGSVMLYPRRVPVGQTSGSRITFLPACLLLPPPAAGAQDDDLLEARARARARYGRRGGYRAHPASAVDFRCSTQNSPGISSWRSRIPLPPATRAATLTTRHARFRRCVNDTRRATTIPNCSTPAAPTIRSCRNRTGPLALLRPPLRKAVPAL